MTPEEIIDEAKRLITKERADAYGDYNSMFRSVATMWTAYFGFNVTAQDIPICMALVKIMRQKQGKDLDDNFIDIGEKLEIEFYNSKTKVKKVQ